MLLRSSIHLVGMAQEKGMEEVKIVLGSWELGVAGVEEFGTSKFTEEALEVLAAAEGSMAGVGGRHLRRVDAQRLRAILMGSDFLLHRDAELQERERRFSHRRW